MPDVMLPETCAGGALPAVVAPPPPPTSSDGRTQSVVLVLCGVPGAGKSTLAAAISTAIATSTLPIVPEPEPEGAPSPSSEAGTDATTAGQSMGQFGQRCEWSCSVLCYDDHIKDPARARQPTTPSALAGPAANQSSPQSTPSRLIASGAEPTLHEQPQEPRAVGGMDAELTRFKVERQGVLGLLREWLEVNAHSQQPQAAPGTPLEAPPTAQPHPSSKVSVLILDDNMYYASMRHAVYKTVREFSGGYATALLDCDLDLAVSRNAARASTVHLDVIKRMALKLEPPRPDKNRYCARPPRSPQLPARPSVLLACPPSVRDGTFARFPTVLLPLLPRWEKHSVVVDASKEISVAVDAVTALCFRAASDPTAPIPEVDSVVTDADRKATADSVRHQVPSCFPRAMPFAREP